MTAQIRKTETENTSEQLSPIERIIVITFYAVILALKIIYIFRYRFDSDEPQHLHVVWGWAHGLLQYRDVFDNHTPLFHLLCTPIFIAIGERPEALFMMRLAMIPLYALALWSTYIIGRVIFSQRVGLWASVFVGLYSSFFLCSVEFRTDDLWIIFWLFAIALLIRGRITISRVFIVGLFLGIATGVSMKTTLMLITLCISALATIVFPFKGRLLKYSFRKLTPYAATMLLGLLLVPLALTLFFYFKGDLAPFFYGAVKHNMLSNHGRWRLFQWKFFLFPIILMLLWWGARAIAFYSTANAGIITRRVFVFFVTGVYISLLKIFWPLVEPQSKLPFYPLFIIFLTPLPLIVVPHWFAKRLSNVLLSRLLSGTLVLFLVAFIEMGILIHLLLVHDTSWRNKMQNQIGLLTDVLQLTNPNDLVMDLKGETIFRQRSFYYVLEGITRTRIGCGLISDDIPERLIASSTCVAILDDRRFTPRTRSFLDENYLPIGYLRVAGQFLTIPASSEMHSIFFDVRIPAPYEILAESSMVTGLLDDTPYQGARFLATGRHVFRTSCKENKLALVWAQAVERGFSPFFSRNNLHDNTVEFY